MWNRRPLQPMSWYWRRTGPFPIRMTLVLPFAIAPVGVVLALVGALGGKALSFLLVIGYSLAWGGFFAAIPCALYILCAWLVIRPTTDRELLCTLVVAPPICGAISEVLETYMATGSVRPNPEAEWFFFKVATALGYFAVLLIVMTYAVRRRSARRRA